MNLLDKLSAEIIVQAEKLKEITISEKNYNQIDDKIIEVIKTRVTQLKLNSDKI